MKNAAFLDLPPCCSGKNQRFGGTYRLRHQDDKNRRARNNVSSNQQLTHGAQKCYVVASSLFLVTLMTEAKRSSETSVLTRVTRRSNLEDSIIHYGCGSK
jgi:hypothetical protein